MAKVRKHDISNRRGFGKCLYISRKADDLLIRLADATRRSQSEIVSLLVETYGPEMLVDRQREERA